MPAPLHYGRTLHGLASATRRGWCGTVCMAMVAGIGLSGCAGSALDTSMLGPTTAALKLPEAPALPKLELPKPADPVLGTPTEVYERVGRGAVTCWFGANGPLKGTHVYEATADSPHKGGQAEISIREKEVAAPAPPVQPAATTGKQQPATAPAGEPAAASASPTASPTRGAKSFRVSIRPEGEDRANVEAENLKLPEELARRMKGNVEAWSTGKEGCEAGVPVTAEASPSAPAAAPAQPAAAPDTPPPKNNKAIRSERMAGSGQR